MKTTSYEISKKLAEAGFESRANFFWCELGEDLVGIHLSQLHVVPQSVKRIVAYDLETILEALPESVKFDNKWAWFEMDKNFIIYKFIDEDKTCLFDFHKQENESLADTAARLLIKLESKGLINFKK
jgi:hypothetical protein